MADLNLLNSNLKNIGELKNYKYSEYVSEWVPGAKGKKYKKTAHVEKTMAGPIQNLQCVAYTTVRGCKDILESSPVSVELAINEGWYTKNGSKWPNMTQQMLMYRAASFWTSAYAPELSMGMKTDDELRDIIDTDYVDVSEKSDHQKKENANKKEVSIPEEKPQSEAPKTNGKAEKRDTLSVKSMAEAKEFLINNMGIAPESLTDNSSISEAANDAGFVIELKKANGPDF